MSTTDPADQPNEALQAARDQLQAARSELQGAEAALRAALDETEDDK
ncbi:hypothetical protein ACFCV3_15650 [Kribbella sp. NPDC056345]